MVSESLEKYAEMLEKGLKTELKKEPRELTKEEKELQDMPLELLLEKQADTEIKNRTDLVRLEAKFHQLDELEKIIHEDVAHNWPKELGKAIVEKKKMIEEKDKELRLKMGKENGPINGELYRRAKNLGKKEKTEDIDKEKYFQIIENIKID